MIRWSRIYFLNILNPNSIMHHQFGRPDLGFTGEGPTAATKIAPVVRELQDRRRIAVINLQISEEKKGRHQNFQVSKSM